MLVKSVRSLNNIIDLNKSITSRANFEATIERAMLNQKYWEELLEKLRKMGGGGGGSDLRFDRIKVSMQLMNFLSNKTIQAIIRNFNEIFLPLIFKSINPSIKLMQNIFINVVQKFMQKAVESLVPNISTNIQNIKRAIRSLSNQLNAFAIALAFQLNKLKEILDEEFKKSIRKFDVNEKIKKLKDLLIEFFVDMKRVAFDFYSLTSSLFFNVDHENLVD